MSTFPTRTNLSRRTGALLASVLLAGSALAGCGGSGSDEPSGAASEPSSVTTPSDAPTTAVGTPTPTTCCAQKPTPTKKPTKRPQHGSGDSAGDDEPAAAGGGICPDLSEAEVGAALGGSVTGSALPGGGCAFQQANRKRPTGYFISSTYTTMDAAENDATSSVEGEPEDLSGIGDGAFVVTGTTFGGPDVEGAGAVHVGSKLVSVQLNQSSGLKAPAVRALVVKLLQLAAGKL